MTYTQVYLLPWANRAWLLFLGSACAHMHDIAWSCRFVRTRISCLLVID